MDISDKSIFITGGAGFIGSHIAHYLVTDNAKFVRVLDDLSSGTYENIRHLEEYDNFEFIQGSITDYDLVLELTDGFDIICHQAAKGSVPKSILEPLNFNDVNVVGFLNILESAKKNNIKRIVYASSSSVYGDDENDFKNENTLGTQLSPYALTKYVDELYAKMFTKLYGLECIGLRYFNVFGPRQNPTGDYAAVVPKFISLIKKGIRPTIYGDGSQSRDFTYIDNVVDANLCAMFIQNEKCYGITFNVGCGTKTTVSDIFNLIAKHFNSDIQPIYENKRIGDIEHSLANADKAKTLLNWLPKINFTDGLMFTIHYY
jgi:UDP-N-acetylglucosamine 4-epimerase